MKAELTRAAIAVADLVDRSTWPLSDDEVIGALTAVEMVTSQLAAVTMALVWELDTRAIPAMHGAPSSAIWLRDHLRIGVRSARHLVALAKLVDTRPAMRDALAAGVVNPEQAGVIGAALAELPHDLDPAVRDKAEALLLDQAGQFEPAILHKLGERVLSHVAPEVAEEALRRKLDRDEMRAYASRTLTITADGEGRSRIFGWLDAESAAIVTAAIDSLCKPIPVPDSLDPHRPGHRHTDSPGSDQRRSERFDPRTPSQRRADALIEVCQLALATTHLPANGGERPHLTITAHLDLITGQLAPGMLDTGQTLSPATVRRLACDARIIPAILGGDGAVLDLGRTRRTYTGTIRRALVVRDQGCAFPGCDRPPRWCDGHHVISWLDGGPTDLDNGVLLCRHHHRVIHHGDWQIRLGIDRRPEFVPPAYLDPHRTPRRNTYHQRP